MIHHVRFMIAMIFVIIMSISSVAIISAQESTPEATSESTPEATAESTPEATAQSCPAIVDTAVNLTQRRCNATSLNQACYGHIFLDARPRTTADLFDFNDPGDVVDLITVESLQLSAMDTTTGQWGVMLMEVEANVDGAIRPEDVQLVLFGDTRLEDASEFASITATESVNIRSRPDTSSAILTTLQADETVIANGRYSEGGWLRVRFSDEADGIGWVAADFVTTQGDPATLRPITPDDLNTAAPDDLSARYGPMQAVFLETGSNDAPCAEAPNSGLLIQTPEGVASVTLWLDEVVIQLEGSGFVQAQAGGEMTVNVIEGSARVEAQGESSTAITGTAVTIPLDDNLRASGTPSDPQPINPADTQALPVDLLDDPVTVPQPVTVPRGQPLAGEWRFAWGSDELPCDNGETVPLLSAGGTTPLQPRDDSVIYGDIRYNETSTGVYRATYTDAEGNLHQDTLRVIAPDRIEGEAIIDLTDPICTLIAPFSLQLVSP